MENCPSCGVRAPVTELLIEGCSRCGRISLRRKREDQEERLVEA